MAVLPSPEIANEGACYLLALLQNSVFPCWVQKPPLRIGGRTIGIDCGD